MTARPCKTTRILANEQDSVSYAAVDVVAVHVHICRSDFSDVIITVERRNVHHWPTTHSATITQQLKDWTCEMNEFLPVRITSRLRRTGYTCRLVNYCRPNSER